MISSLILGLVAILVSFVICAVAIGFVVYFWIKKRCQEYGPDQIKNKFWIMMGVFLSIAFFVVLLLSIIDYSLLRENQEWHDAFRNVFGWGRRGELAVPIWLGFLLGGLPGIFVGGLIGLTRFRKCRCIVRFFG